MQTALVYLRPTPVAFMRTESVERERAVALWGEVCERLADMGLLESVDRVYGMAHGSRRMGCSGNNAHYVAAAEVISGMPIAPASAFRLMTLPGGAYLRRRLTTGLDHIAQGFSQLCEESRDHHDILLDRRRPLVEIHLLKSPGVVDPAKIELCVPVRPRFMKADNQAA